MTKKTLALTQELDGVEARPSKLIAFYVRDRVTGMRTPIQYGRALREIASQVQESYGQRPLVATECEIILCGIVSAKTKNILSFWEGEPYVDLLDFIDRESK